MVYDRYQLIVIDSKNRYFLHDEEGVSEDRVHLLSALGFILLPQGSPPPPSICAGEKIFRPYAPMPARYVGKASTRERRERAKRSRERARTAA